MVLDSVTGLSLLFQIKDVSSLRANMMCYEVLAHQVSEQGCHVYCCGLRRGGQAKPCARNGEAAKREGTPASVALQPAVGTENTTDTHSPVAKDRLSDAGGPGFESKTGRFTGKSVPSRWRDEHPAIKRRASHPDQKGLLRVQTNDKHSALVARACEPAARPRRGAVGSTGEA